MLGLAALFVETSLLAFSAYAALIKRAHPAAITEARSGVESAGLVPGNSSAA
jgi:hypothetical protein